MSAPPSSSSSSTTKPPRKITLPTSSTYVFSSSRNPRLPSVSPCEEIDQPAMAAPPSTSVVFGTQQQSPFGSPSTERPPRSRPALNERHLARHGAGAQDLRSALVYARTPAGFIPFETAPASPLLGPPPVYDPGHNPFFPPLVVLGGGSSNMHAHSHSNSYSYSATIPLASVPEGSSPMPSSIMSSPTWTETAVGGSTPMEQCLPPRTSHVRPAPSVTSASHSSSQSSTSTLYTNTDMSVNARSPPSSRRSSRMSVSSAHTQKGLSLTELFAADWQSSAPPPPSNSSIKRRERRTKENAEAESKARKYRRAAKGERTSSSSSDNDKNPPSSPDLKSFSKLHIGSDKLSKPTVGFPKVVDTCTPDHPTKWTPD